MTPQARERSFHTATLKNGTRVATAPMPWLSRAHVVVQLRGGPVHEDDDTWGMSHFLEHMIFRGTNRHADVHALAMSADAFGGDVAAATYRDRVVLDTRCDPDRIEEAFQLFASMIAAPRFASLQVERSIVEEEIAELFDDEGRDVDPENALFARMFAGGVLARSIEGTVATLEGFGKRAVRRFHERAYVGHNLVVSVAGPLTPRQVEHSARRAFAHVPAGMPLRKGTPPAARRLRSAVEVLRTDAPQTSVRLSIPLPASGHPDAAAGLVLARLLDDGPASRLQAEVVDRLGLAYSVWAMADIYEDGGLLEIGGGVRADRVGQLVTALARELRDLAAHPPSRSEVKRVAERYARDVRDALDDPALLAESLGKGVLFDDPYRPAHSVARVRAVRPATVQRLARIGLAQAQLVLAGMPSRASVAQAKTAIARLHG